MSRWRSGSWMPRSARSTAACVRLSAMDRLLADQDVVSFDPDLELLHAVGRFREALAARHVELVGVPGASHDSPGELSFSQRAVLVRAAVVDDVVDAVHVEEGHRHPSDINGFSFPPRDLVSMGDPH